MPKTFILIVGALLSAALVQAHPKVISSSKPSDFVLQVTKKWLSKTAPFKNSSSDQEMSKSIADLLSWTPPDYYVKHFPYYLSGLSDEKIPIYIFESGKYDLVALMRQGPEVVDNFDNFFIQGILRGLKTLEPGGLDGKTYKTHLILDFEGLTYAHYTSVPAIELMTKTAMQLLALAEKMVDKVYVINGNYAVDTLYGALRPYLGRVAERVEIYGKKTKWLPVLKREFPPDALPSWYGGSDNFTPIAAYG